MPQPADTEIRINERGDETHESWLLVRAGRTSTYPGQHLFQSEMAHHQYIQVTVTRCTRRRDLNHDWLYGTETLIEFAMPEAGWGAFVSSFGQGQGVPATLTFLQGQGAVPQAPFAPRLAESHDEVKNAGHHALQKIQEAQQAVQEAFDQNLGKKELRSRLHTLKCMVENGPGTMEFAAKSLTDHVEKVVTKARADIEGMVLSAQQHGVLDATEVRLIEGATQNMKES